MSILGSLVSSASTVDAGAAANDVNKSGQFFDDTMRPFDAIPKTGALPPATRTTLVLPGKLLDLYSIFTY
jgi:hypothetical protein